MNFLKHALVICSIVVGTVAAQADEIRIVVGEKLPPAAALALTELRAALTDRGEQIVDPAKADDKTFTILVGLEQDHKVFDGVERMTMAGPTGGPEAALLDLSTPQTLVVQGWDERGLTYALRDAARGIATTPRHKPWTDGITPGIEAPFLKVRNVSLHLFNADCEREWFFSEEFWRFYFQRLSLSRFNRCTLTFCDQTNYLCPPYAYLVEMPEYPKIQVADCTPEQRVANRAMLKRIAELADEYAIDFDLGIWMQGPVAKWAAPVQVSGLPEGMELAKYCALGLRRILEACPSVDGIQLRMNAEAGVPEDQQTAFYRPMFQALAAVQAAQRPEAPYRLELRYKGLTQETIDAAIQEKLDVTVSTKFWAEHFGLPYHPTVVDSHYAKDRYSFGTLLKKPRDYRVTYQLWTVGSQRLTLWGDPEYAKQFAQSCTLGGGEGFEVFAPLTNKGYGNRPGAWQVIKDPAYRVGKWEQERYWAFYLAFGRLGYNPNTSLDFWHREFRHRFGDAGEDIEKAYRAASRVLPLITAALLPSASEWYWWPEMDTGGNLREYSRIQPSDPGRFVSIRSWERTPSWRWEEWDARPGHVDMLRIRPMSIDERDEPFRLSQALDDLGGSIANMLGYACAHKHPVSAEWKSTETDLRLLWHLSHYHVRKLNAAMHLTVAETYQSTSRFRDARQSMDFAVDEWKKIIEVTDGVYHDDLVFGITADSPRSKQGHHHSGHWKDRLGEVEASARELVQHPLERAMWHNPKVPLEQPSPPYSIDFEHVPPSSLRSGKSPDLTLTIPGDIKPHKVSHVTAHVRALDQTQKWRAVPMQRKTETPGQAWHVSVPNDAIDSRFDLQYFLVVSFEGTHPTRIPESRIYETFGYDQLYFVVPVEAK